MKVYITLFAAGILLIACAPKNVEAVTEEVVTEVQDSNVEEGKMLYSQKCGKCHDLKVIDNYTKDQWANILPKMGVKAKLTDAEYAQVNAYVQWELEH